ncbi:PREDICTED: uncharacterized protein LOC107066432 [Polistes dominula]|uniref:Uncharacterized protein LOC107066432 n=1 Tax=Polistes dominula TaxID=743375 RepID=A0ABM1I8J1_POLDO|nr:PREDICTED: uncharacterized protein LOC107066432 [Polistes dominula]XP_015176529.1 PREDICTED: uncharacterized protein LOC107066432 [Polistes dominula]
MESGVHKSPLITNAISAVLAQTYNAQLSPDCADFELRAIECYEAYGLHGGTRNKICQDFMDDLRECMFKTKTALRYHEMQKERYRQYKEGLRKEQYSPAPNQDHE